MDATDCKWVDISELLVLFASHQQLQLQFYIIIRQSVMRETVLGHLIICALLV